MKLIKYTFAVIFAFTLLFSTVLAGDEGGVQIKDYEIPNDSSLPILSDYAMLYDESEGRVLYKKGDESDGGEYIPPVLEPASTVKLMVGIIACEKWGHDLSRSVTVTKEMLEGKEGLSMYIEPGEVWTLYDLICATVMYGANDACLILVRHEGGTVSDFLQLMNAKAASIGCTNTYYKNVTGLHADGAVTTLEDMIKIAAYASDIPQLIKITSLDKHTVAENATTPQRTVLSRNHLVSKFRDTRYYTEGVTGLNFGSTDETGEILIVSSEYSGKKYFIALFGGYETEKDENGNTRQTVFDDAVYLINYAKEAFGYTDLIDTGRIVAEIPVLYNITIDRVSLAPSSSVSLFLPKDIDIEEDIKYSVIVYDTELAAPVIEGQTAGEMVLYYLGEELCRIPLVTTSAVAQSKLLYTLDRIEEFVLSTKFFVFVGSVILLSVIYVTVNALLRGRRKRRRKRLR